MYSQIYLKIHISKQIDDYLKIHLFSEIYLNATDRRILDFYYANLELRMGTMLKNISLNAFATPMTNNFVPYHYAGMLHLKGFRTIFKFDQIKI